MSTPEPDMQTYSEAIEMLRRRNLWMKWARAGGLVIFGVFLLAGDVRLAGLAALVLGASLLLLREPLSASPFYAAEKFILTDNQKKVRAVLGVDEEYSTLRLFSEGGDMVLDLAASSDHSTILLAPGTGKESASLSFQRETGPMLTLRGMFGEAIMGACRIPGGEHLSTTWAPGPFVSMKDASGRSRAFLYAVSGDLGGTDFALADGSGRAEASIYVAEGGTRVEIGERGRPRTVLGRSRADALEGIVLLDKDGGVIWRAP